MDIATLLFGFQGRIDRMLWWLTSLGMSIIMGVIIAALVFGLGTQVPSPEDLANHQPPGLVWVIIGILCFVLLWIGLALNAKRWHDRGKSAWWSLIVLLPLIGGLWLLIECGFLPGTEGPNAYGPDPLKRD